MTSPVQLPRAEIMKQMAEIAFEDATSTIAAHARELAKVIPEDMNPRQALLGFADAIESTNAKRYPRGPQS